MNRPIRFLRLHRGHKPGEVNDVLLPGVRELWVRRGIAEWVDEAAKAPVVQQPKRKVTKETV